jgi:hypothetical protein
MKGIYLTEEGQKEIEAKITELENKLNLSNHFPMALSGKILCLKEILSSATILPIEESWDKLFPCSWNSINKQEIKNGVIIKPKQ